MVSRWNYIAITAVMATVFFLFQFTNVMLEDWNDYEENSYIRHTKELPGRSDAYTAGTEYTADTGRELIIYIGNTENAVSEVVRSWASYAKKNLLSYDTLEQFEAFEGIRRTDLPGMVILDAGSMAEDTDYTYLKTCAEAGISLVFGRLPDVSVLEQDIGLQRLLGVSKIRKEEITTAGIHLYDGFLLGGEAVYYTEDEEENARRQDMELTFPWYVLSSGTEVYMSGIPAEDPAKEKEAPPVIWRNDDEGTDIFAVNSSYMEDAAGIGILSAISAKINHYEIHPVVNAQNLLAVNYPELSEENEEEMRKQYGQSAKILFRDRVWPALIAVYRQNMPGLTCMLAPQLDYEADRQPDAGQLLYYMKRLNEERAETGLSGFCVSDTPIGQKLQKDQIFMEGALPDYRFTSFYAGDLTEKEVEAALQEEILSDIRTVAADYDGTGEVVGYQTEEVTRQSVLTDGVGYTYHADFRSRSVETALGYASVMADLSRMVYPSGEQDGLTDLASFSGWYTEHNFGGFCGFEGTTLSRSDERIRSFLALDYAQYREKDSIYIELENVPPPAWFVLRCTGEVPDHVEGGDWKELERGAYLIEAQKKHVVITLKAGRD